MHDWYDVKVEVDGRKHQGYWTLKQGKLCVGGYYGARSVQLRPGQRTIDVAKELLRELVLAWLAERQPPAPRVQRPRTDNRPFPITVIVAGKPYSGTWTMLGGEVFVSSAYRDRSAPVKRSTPERVAERLMKEAVKEWLAAR